MGKRYRWSRERIVEEIQNLHEQGIPLHMASVRRVFPSLVATACSKKYFGSWKAAVEAAGFNYEEIIQVKRWSEERVLEEIRKIQNSTGDLRPSSVARFCQTLLMAAKKFFGSWRGAVIAAGIDYDLHVRQRKQSRVDQDKDEIIKEIRRLYREGRIDELSGAWRYHLSLFRKARHRFGSWKKAMEAAGLNYSEIVQRQKWTKERIIAEIRRLYAEGKDLSITAMQRTYPNLVAIAQSPRYFGSWRAAVESAGLDYELIKRQRGRRRREPIQVRV
ncbi:MAG: hypothetical protein NZ805_09020 [Armatimonadetes bacterium]|nr:hypothetical protein [Armatimonadota bacterium]MDW8029496.1 hypothetical protein [Armatimonadota bacterium]